MRHGLVPPLDRAPTADSPETPFRQRANSGKYGAPGDSPDPFRPRANSGKYGPPPGESPDAYRPRALSSVRRSDLPLADRPPVSFADRSPEDRPRLSNATPRLSNASALGARVFIGADTGF